MAGCCGAVSDWFYNVTHTPISRRKFLIGCCVCGVVLVVVIVLAATLSASSETPDKHRGSIINSNPLVVGSNDLLRKIKTSKANMINNIDLQTSKDFETNFDILKNASVASQVWKLSTGCKDSQFKDVVGLTLDEIDIALRIKSTYSNRINIARSFEDVSVSFREKKLAVFLSLEGGHAIASKLSALRVYAELGVRIMPITSNCSTPWAGANLTDTDKGLSSFGEEVVKEMNRLGMVIDLTGASKKTQLNVIEKTKAPVIFSHSNAQKYKDHPFNVQDDVLEKAKENKALVMVSFSQEQLHNNTLQGVIEHLNYLRDKVGVDCVGIGGNFDSDLEVTFSKQIAAFSKLFDALQSTNWTSDELKKLAGGNFKRILESVKKVSEDAIKDKPSESREPGDDFTQDQKSCFSDILADFPQSSTTTAPTFSSTKNPAPSKPDQNKEKAS